MKYKNLTIIGTSHIAKQSLQEVEKTINKIKPEIVAIELDKKRFHALTSKAKRRIRLSDIKRVGLKGFLFSLIGGWAEKKLGKVVGVSPGSEMITAINLAKKHNSQIALVDQDIEITLKRLSQEFSFREKWNFFVDILKGIFAGKRELRKMGIKNIDLTKVPSKKLIKILIRQVKKRYPSLYKILIQERNQVIAQNLKQLMELNPDCQIVAVLGAGHEEEVIDIIKNQEISYSLNIG